MTKAAIANANAAVAQKDSLLACGTATADSGCGVTVKWLYQVLREGREGNPKMMSLGLHLRIIGRPGRIWALEQFLAHVRQHDDVWIATRHQIAQALAAVDPA